MHARSYNTKQQLLHAKLLRCRIAMETHFSWDHQGEWNRDRTTQKVHESQHYLPTELPSKSEFQAK